MAWTQVSDIETLWFDREIDSPQAAIASLITKAEALILSEYPTVQERIDDGDLNEELVRWVVCEMVLRVLRNPGNRRSQQLSDFAESFAGDRVGGLWLTDDERRILSGASGGTGAAFTIDPTPEASPARELANAWVNGPLGAEPGYPWV